VQEKDFLTGGQKEKKIGFTAGLRIRPKSRPDPQAGFTKNKHEIGNVGR